MNDENNNKGKIEPEIIEKITPEVIEVEKFDSSYTPNFNLVAEEKNEEPVIIEESFDDTKKKAKKIKKNAKKKSTTGKFIAAGLAGVLVGGTLMATYALPTLEEQIVNRVLSQVGSNTNNVNVATSLSDNKLMSISTAGNAEEIIAKVKASVVTIGITANSDVNAFGFFKENNSEDNTQGSEKDDNDIVGAGTGVIFKEDDKKVYIVTNAHVISGASGVKVWLDGSEKSVPALLVGSEPSSDLAVISILKADLKVIGINEVTTAVFGDSDTVSMGSPVIAIGNALGEGISSTGGMVSIEKKTISVGAGENLTVMQTDASINPGNSGGPLVNYKGEIVGINTAKLMQSSAGLYGNSETVEGMGYAITSNSVVETIDEIMNKANKPFLGIKGYNISQEIAEAYSLPTMGVVVNTVLEGSSAADTDLQPNDIITSVDGNPVKDIESFSEYIKSKEINDEIELKVFRDGEIINIKVKLKKYEDIAFN